MGGPRALNCGSRVGKTDLIDGNILNLCSHGCIHVRKKCEATGACDFRVACKAFINACEAFLLRDQLFILSFMGEWVGGYSHRYTLCAWRADLHHSMSSINTSAFVGCHIIRDLRAS